MFVNMAMLVNKAWWRTTAACSPVGLLLFFFFLVTCGFTPYWRSFSCSYIAAIIFCKPQKSLTNKFVRQHEYGGTTCSPT